MTLQPKQTILNGKYHILQLIRAGGMARVWLAEELTFGGRKVALKEPRADLLPDLVQELRLRYQREVHVCAALEQAKVPHIVRALTAEPYDSGLLLVMEYMPGGDLSALLKQHPEGLPIEQVVEITLDLLRALEGVHAHELEIVHRDIKPSNILFDKEGRAHVADFGLAQVAGGSQNLTKLLGGGVPGTPLYAAPEQEAGKGYLTPAADLYALGCVLFEILTGKRYKHYRPGTQASSLQAEVPRWLDEVLGGALAEGPWDRWRTAGEMAGVLEAGWAQERARVAAREHARRERETRARREAQERAREQRLAGWYDEAMALVNESPRGALDWVAQIRREEPDYPNLARLEERAQRALAEQRRKEEAAQRQRVRKQLRQQAEEALAAKNWAEALSAAERLAGPGGSGKLLAGKIRLQAQQGRRAEEKEGRRQERERTRRRAEEQARREAQARARREVEERERQEVLAVRVAEIQGVMAEDPEEALRLVAQLRAEEPGYADWARLAAQAQAALDKQRKHEQEAARQRRQEQLRQKAEECLAAKRWAEALGKVEELEGLSGSGKRWAREIRNKVKRARRAEEEERREREREGGGRKGSWWVVAVGGLALLLIALLVSSALWWPFLFPISGVPTAFSASRSPTATGTPTATSMPLSAQATSASPVDTTTATASITPTPSQTPTPTPTPTPSNTPIPTPGSAGADQVVAFNPGPGAKAEYSAAEALLGAPDLIEKPCCQGMLQLGQGGSVLLAFTDNTIVDEEGPDFEVYGESVQDDYLLIEVSADGQVWYAYPKASESPGGLDLAAVGLAQVAYVRLTDLQPGTWTGAEVDAVTALHSGSGLGLPLPNLPDAVARRDISLREGPDTRMKRAGEARTGETVSILGRSRVARWVKVKTEGGGRGWCSVADLGLNVNLNHYPLAYAPPTPTPTATAVPASAILYSEDFENGTPDGWIVYVGTWSVEEEENGNHFWRGRGPSNYPQAWLSSTGAPWTDYAFETRIRVVRGTVFVCIRADEGAEFYTAYMNSHDGWFSFADYVGREFKPFGGRDYAIATNRWYTVRFEAQDDALRLFIDDRLVGTAHRSSRTQGGVGYYMGGGDEIHFDEIRIWALAP